jgi:hypothetical protein
VVEIAAEAVSMGPSVVLLKRWVTGCIDRELY